MTPHLDDKVVQGAEPVGLPKTPSRLASYVSSDELPRLGAACVRAALLKEVAEDVRR